MRKQSKLVTVLVSLVVMSGVIILGACATLPMAGSQGGMEAQVNTAVAATVVQHLIETKVAAQAQAAGGEPVAQAQPSDTPTATPVPPTFTPTLVPTVMIPVDTATPVPAAPAVAVVKPVVKADADTNCRVGPSTSYSVATFFRKGTESTVEGRDANKDWWYIANPAASGGFCWVWDGSTTVKGDTSEVPVVAAPSFGFNTATNSNYSGCNGYGCNTCGNTCGCGCGCQVDLDKCKWDKCGCYTWNATCCNNTWGNCCNDNWNCCWNGVNNQWCGCDTCYNGCNCNNTCNDPWCKKGGCPPLTEVNYKNYCKNYPKCCK